MLKTGRSTALNSPDVLVTEKYSAVLTDLKA